MAQYKIEYDNVLYAGTEDDDKVIALEELLEQMREGLKKGSMKDFVTLKRREDFNDEWKIVYTGIYV